MLLLLFLSTVLGGSGSCASTPDRLIYSQRGHEFPALFRSFAGLTVSRANYEQKIISQVGLSAPCAACYGEAYICGWDSCAVKCMIEGNSCNVCLKDAKCIEKCNECTGLM